MSEDYPLTGAYDYRGSSKPPRTTRTKAKKAERVGGKPKGVVARKLNKKINTKAKRNAKAKAKRVKRKKK